MIEKTQREYKNIESLRNWDKNPRSISKKDFKRLLTQIKKLGQYKPLIITQDGLVLGGNIVLDPFGGSGSTLIACQKTDRVCRTMELDPKYCDVIRKRYSMVIGEENWEEATPKTK